MRNSSLVEWCCAEDVAGLKPAAEAVDSEGALKILDFWDPGRMVGERSVGSEGELKGLLEPTEERMPA